MLSFAGVIHAMFPQISANAFHCCLITVPLILYKVEASKGGIFFH